MTEDNRTESELLAEAYACQDACNLSGVVNSFTRAIARLWKIAHEGSGKGTEWVNTHPVCKLFSSKIVSLSGEPTGDDWNNAYQEAKKKYSYIV